MVRFLLFSCVILCLDFQAYAQAAAITREVFTKYDPNFDSMSMDEASLDVTDYIHEHFSDLSQSMNTILIGARIAQEIRETIQERTQLTCSGGIAPNRMLAKICSDFNKPNGQKYLLNTLEEIQ